MNGEIITTGTELLLGQVVNSNARYLAQKLAELGVFVYYQVTVGDNRGRLVEAIREAMGRADVVVITGGLGPTEDDVTREAVAEALGAELVEDEEAAAMIRDFFRRRGYALAESNLRQARVIRGSRVLANQVGTAPGMIVEAGPKVLILLPGPPREMMPMLEEQVLSYLRARMAGKERVVYSRTLKLCGIGEASVEERIHDLLRGQGNPTLAPLASLGEVQLRLTAVAANADSARELIAPVEKEIRRRLGRYIFGADDDTLEGVVGAILRERGITLAVAESCSGGTLSTRLTDVAGSSAYFMLGVVAYDNRWKEDILGVDRQLLETHGAVSREVAEAMARGVRRLAGCDLGLGVTGIAGPGGGTQEKPVGLVYTALASSGGTRVRRDLYWGSRQEIKERSARGALVMLWRYLVEGT